MNFVLNTVAAVAIAATAFSVSPSFAKGGDGAEQREKLQAALAEARANDTGPSIFETLFGADSDTAESDARSTTQ